MGDLVLTDKFDKQQTLNRLTRLCNFLERRVAEVEADPWKFFCEMGEEVERLRQEIREVATAMHPMVPLDFYRIPDGPPTVEDFEIVQVPKKDYDRLKAAEKRLSKTTSEFKISYY